MLVAVGSGSKISSRPFPRRHLVAVSVPSVAVATSSGLPEVDRARGPPDVDGARTPVPLGAAQDRPTREIISGRYPARIVVVPLSKSRRHRQAKVLHEPPVSPLRGGAGQPLIASDAAGIGQIAGRFAAAGG